MKNFQPDSNIVTTNKAGWGNPHCLSKYSSSDSLLQVGKINKDKTKQMTRKYHFHFFTKQTLLFLNSVLNYFSVQTRCF